MKILIVNTFDRGGAANACLRLHEGLLQDGVDSKVLLKFGKKQIPKAYRFKHTLKKKSRLEKAYLNVFNRFSQLKNKKENLIKKNNLFLEERSLDLELFSFPQSRFDITESLLYKEADIINLHWVADFLDYDSFFRKNTKPVVWTLHDMNPFSGGDHYEGLSQGISDLGYPIQRSISEEELRIVNNNIILKKQIFKEVDNFTIVAPSTWLAEEAKKSIAFQSKPVCCIPYGINTSVFKMQDRALSRSHFNIPKDKKVILFVADSLQNQRKGFEFLIRAFRAINRNDVVLCSIGSNESNLDTIENIIPLGVIKTEHLMSMAYSAADVFVIPSLMDNLPNTVIESLLCGTPVIGFPVGGIPDIIRHGENGLLTEKISVTSLSETLITFLDSVEAFDRNVIRKNAIKKYDLSVQSKKYITLFKDMLQ